MPACTTPLLCPVWWAPTSDSFSSTRSARPGCRSASSLATASPTIPAPTTAMSHSPEGSWSGPVRAVGLAPGSGRAFNVPFSAGTFPHAGVFQAGVGLRFRGDAPRLVRSIVAVLAAFGCLGTADAGAAEQHAYAVAMNYATATITMGQGDKLTFTNLDNIAKHNLVDHDGHFGSDLLGSGESGPVRGVDKLTPGTYHFHCSLHSWMEGVLQVTPAGGGGTPSEPSVGGGGAGSPTAGSALTPNPYDIWPHAAQAPTGKASWTSYGKDLSNSRNGGRAAPSASQVPALGVAWSFHSGWGDFLGTPAVARGLVVAGTFDGHVVALDSATGRLRWHYDAGQPVNASVAIAGGRVFVPVAQPHTPRMVALRLKDGRKLWDVPIDTQRDSDVYGSPLVWKGTVYQGISALFGEL